MNLQKLFEMQRVLKDHIGYEGTDRFEKLILALLVEVGECANEWKGFKFWSKNQQPNTKALRYPAMMEEDKEYYNPLLEEYVDGLHFVLELGLEIDEIKPPISSDLSCYKEGTIEQQFLFVYENALMMKHDNYFVTLVNSFLALAEMLGFTWEQIEQAYMDKNKVNHERQDNGY